MADENDPRLPVAETPAAAPPVENEAPLPEDDQEGGAAEIEESVSLDDDEPSDDAEGGQPSPDTVRRREQRQRAEERLKQQNERLRRENLALRSRVGTVQPDINAEVERVIGKPPKEEDYRGDYLAFNTALTAYELDKRQVTRDVRKQFDTQQRQNASLDESLRADQLADAAAEHQERIKDFRSKTPDFDAVLAEANRREMKASPALEELILESENSAHLVYFLARNPKVLDDLNSMNERQAARSIGIIESRLSLPSNPRTQTRAPAPIQRLTGGAAPPSSERDLDAWLSRKYGRRK